uniref:Retrovirus-related Pol polyprotein from transposon TNT 1-94 n=1 Tax=Tanacetum cinerariifolium TaxID=118510 RepID=A0A6L2LIS5_TANCI|nr:retrovirus-related Pol polyprotein from transposon TNT 1-94 [Tanacetum cinerariifolium]
MTGNKSHLANYQEFKGCFVSFGGSDGRITGKGTIKAGMLDFEDVYYVEELKHYNLFSVSQMCDKKNKVLFTDTNWLVLSPDVKLPDENQGNLVRGLPSKILANDHTCVAYQKGKQHKVSCKAKTAEAVNTACYVLNRVLVTKPQNKTPYKLLTGRQPIISYLRPFGCYVTILNTIDQLGKFDGKFNLGFLVGYSLNRKAFSTPIRTAGPSRALNDDEPSYLDDPLMPHLKDIYASPSEGIFSDSSYDDEGMIYQALEDERWVDAMQKELLQFQIQKGVVVRNKARFIAQGHRQEKGIDYNEVFALVAKIEAIRIFLTFASYFGFIVYQMDVKSAFLYGTIDEEVYVTQPPGFVDPKFLNKVYKFVKALYGLHQAPRAWYATLSTFLEKDDIIFGLTKKSWCDEFEELMKKRYQMSSMGDLTFFLGLQVTPKTLHLQAVKRIFRYLKGQPKLGLCNPKVLSFDLEAYSDSDYASTNLDRKSTTRATLVKGRLLEVTNAKHRLLLPIIEVKLNLKSSCWDRGSFCVGFHTTPQMVISLPCLTHIKNLLVQEQTTLVKNWLVQSKRLLAMVSIKKVNDVVNLRAIIDRKRVDIIEDVIRHALRLDDADGVECLPNEEIFTKLTRMGYEKPPPKLTFYKAFFFAQWKLLIYTLV